MMEDEDGGISIFAIRTDSLIRRRFHRFGMLHACSYLLRCA